MNKKLIIMRGLPGSGKSTWIKDKGYEIYSLNMDSIRLMLSEPNPTISQEYNREVYRIFYNMLETRMKNGSFTVIDNTNLTLKTIKPYIELATKYGFEYQIIDFSGVSLDDCIQYNLLREEYKVVPEEIIRKMHDKMANSQDSIERFINSDSLHKPWKTK